MEGIEPDINGACPSIERVWAAEVLYSINPRLLFVASGGLTNVAGRDKGETTARVVRAELAELGVPSDQIHEEAESFTSFEQLVNCSAIARGKQWKEKDIGILTLFWHLPRVMAQMVEGREQASIEPFRPGVTTLLSVERVLEWRDREKWNKYFTDFCPATWTSPTLFTTMH